MLWIRGGSWFVGSRGGEQLLGFQLGFLAMSRQISIKLPTLKPPESPAVVWASSEIGTFSFVVIWLLVTSTAGQVALISEGERGVWMHVIPPPTLPHHATWKLQRCNYSLAKFLDEQVAAMSSSNEPFYLRY